MNDTAEPDLTPMLDVVFILLIFFVVTATFVKEIGISPPAPSDNPVSSEPQESIVLEIRNDDRYYIANRQVDRRTLGPYLTRLHAERPEQILMIRSSLQASTDRLVHAMDAADTIGIPLAVTAID